MNAISRRLAACAIGGAVIAQSLAAQPVLQRGDDSNVSGSTLHETILNATNVNPNAFGLVMKLAVDDNVFAQPLYVPDVEIANLGRHNVLYVATMSDTAYAFDADAGTPLWSVNLASLVDATPILIAKFAFSGKRNIIGSLGILSTPVIDPSTHIMYVVAATLENGTMTYRLHAIDITNGSEPYGPGALIPGSYGGSTFDARYQTQRVSLVLSGEQVVFGFGALELEYAGGYVGWVMAFNKTTLQPSGTFATISTGSRGGGVWQSGRPPVVDTAGYVYTFVGNGYSSGYDGVSNFNESALKLDPANGLQLVDWFTPGNWAYLDAKDLDFTGSGPLMIPGTTLLAGGGKTGDLYVLESTNLGKYNATDAQVVQKENITSGREIPAAAPCTGGARGRTAAPCSTIGVPTTCSEPTRSAKTGSRPIQVRWARTAPFGPEASSRSPPTANRAEAACSGRRSRPMATPRTIRPSPANWLRSTPRTSPSNCGTRP
jgi:hypothetical protein